jgi:vitamin B12 transporter
LKNLVFIAILLFSFCSQAQVRKQEVEEVTIDANKLENRRIDLNSNRIERKYIQELQPEDVGVLLQKFPGVSLKSYGGLGGLKTFSFRSLGSQHTATVLDGFLIQNSQSGQINLGQIQTSSIEKIDFGSAQNSILTPVSALHSSNELSFSTFEGNPSFNSTKIRLSSKQGSFGQYDEYLALQFAKEKFGVAIHGKYRRAEGNYPFQFKILNYTYDGIQQNNQLEEIYSGLSLFFRPNKMKQPIRLIYRNTFIDQGLPGATVLYNSYGKQYLKTAQHSFFLDWTDKIGLATVRYYSSYQYDNQIYTDSFYLNKSALFRKEYEQHNAVAGIRLSKNKFGELINFYGGLETRYSQLSFLDYIPIKVQRSQTFTTAGLKINEKKFLFDLRVGYQFFFEPARPYIVSYSKHLPFSSINLESTEIGKQKWKIGGLASYSTRMPSFNEQYYSQLSSKLALNPEIVKQFTLSNGISKSFEKWLFTTKVQLYYNHITDKILAIPTKNLFVWSIQNIGEVHASGIDLVQSFNFQFNNNWNTSLNANYSFQRSIDRSDKNSPSYGDQIAYIPLHTGNLDFSIYRKSTGLRFSGLFVGERYSLNQNVYGNLLNPFYTMDIALFQSLKLNTKHQFNLQFQVKNIANASYVYVRSFVMPGRNYLISLSYEF